MVGDAAGELQKVRVTLPDLASDLRRATMAGTERPLMGLSAA
ncbi:hypothetical protein [Amycolatopsis eburnea]|nr:hypothetical protein [Amycolatopsis eburnea]